MSLCGQQHRSEQRFWCETLMDPRYGPMLKQREWEHGWFGSPCVRKRAADKRVGKMRAISRLIALRGAGGW